MRDQIKVENINQIRAELDLLQTELSNLKALVQQNDQKKEPVIPTSRRNLLRTLAAAILVGTALAGKTPQAEAKFVAAKGAGAIIVPPGGTISGNLPSSSGFGMGASPDPVLNLNDQIFNAFPVGVFGYTGQSSSYGVIGHAETGAGVVGSTNSGWGVLGITNQGYAGLFSGDVDVIGTLTKSAGSFKIDHPLDPVHKYLYHSFVESPDMKNIYDGVVTLDGKGEATVDLPAWFETLNRDFRYQLTSLGIAGPNLYISEKVAGGKFKIGGGNLGQEVSWQITGIRQDPYANSNRTPIEQNKPDEEQGLYLHPTLYQEPVEKGIGFNLNIRARVKGRKE